MRNNIFLLAVLICCFITHITYAQTNTDEIKELPGLAEQPKFKHYAGYLQGNATNGRYLFYWFVESQNSPSTDPFVVWLNGGPGCSSLAGLTTEHGPYMVNPDGKTLRVNDYSWNKVANVLYLEAPAGVGFSYSENPSDYRKFNDLITSDDSYHFLLNFFQKYPQFMKNEFYISGESYGGHYVPSLALRIHQGNANKEGQLINLKGIFVGNGCTSDDTDANSIPPFMVQHSLIPVSMYDQGVKDCNGDFYKNQQEHKCASFLTQIWNKLDGINPYYLYDSCPWTGVGMAKQFAKKLPGDEKMHPLFTLWRRRISRELPATFSSSNRVGTEFDTPCVPDSMLAKYLNSDEVKKAIHATRPIPGGAWSICSDEVNENYDWTYKSMLPIYEKLAPYHIMVFTGDVDMVVNSLGTQLAIDRLNRTIVSDWKAWRVEVGGGAYTVGGFHRKFSNPDPRGSLQFVTIRGAGHMVGLARPLPNLEFFSRQLKNPGNF
jgi:cathepsin A (carboxypeptidase C)